MKKKTPHVRTLPPTAESSPSLAQLLAAALAENERMAKLLDELREENAALKRKNAALTQENITLRDRLNQNSANSNQPPSQDSPFQEPPKPAAPGASDKAKVQKSRPYHKGARQRLLEPDEVIPCLPGPCPSCGSLECVDLRECACEPHQWIELRQDPIWVVHYRRMAGRCPQCGKRVKGRVPKGYETGYGPRLTALIAMLNAGMAVSRRKIEEGLNDVFGIPISQGAIDKCIKRAAGAIEPHYEAIGRAVRASPVNHVDETTWRQHGPAGKALLWLWVLVNRFASFFRLAPSRKAEEFEALRGGWVGTLVSDDYAVYRSWEYGRQTCLAHLIRAAQGLSESGDKRAAACGRWGLKELSRLVRMSPTEISLGEWRAFYARFCRYIAKYRDAAGKAGAFVRRLEREFPELITFLVVPGVEPTNNLAERSVRHGVVLRKTSLGTSSEAGRRWIERALSLYQTCRLQKRSFFEVMRDALCAAHSGLAPALGWIEDIAKQYAPPADTQAATP